VGFLPVFFPPQGCLGHAPVHAQPLPVDAPQAVVFEQPGLPQRQEDAGLDPLLEAVVGGGAGAELGGIQGLPLAAGTQHEEDGVQAHPIGGAWPSAAEAVGVHVAGEVHLELGPQVIRDAPGVGNRILVHVCTGERGSVLRKESQLRSVVIALPGLFG
jgi:hypothetical protein